MKLFPLLPSIMSMFKTVKRLEASKQVLPIHSFTLDKPNFFLDFPLQNDKTSFVEIISHASLSSNKTHIQRSISCSTYWLSNRDIRKCWLPDIATSSCAKCLSASHHATFPGFILIINPSVVAYNSSFPKLVQSTACGAATVLSLEEQAEDQADKIAAEFEQRAICWSPAEGCKSEKML